MRRIFFVGIFAILSNIAAQNWYPRVDTTNAWTTDVINAGLFNVRKNDVVPKQWTRS